jgi:hypothetical protein
VALLREVLAILGQMAFNAAVAVEVRPTAIEVLVVVVLEEELMAETFQPKDLLKVQQPILVRVQAVLLLVLVVMAVQVCASFVIQEVKEEVVGQCQVLEAILIIHSLLLERTRGNHGSFCSFRRK